MGGACRRTGRWELLPTPTSLFSAAAARAGEVDAGVGQVAGSSGGRRVQGVGGRPARGATPNRRCADASGSWPPARRCARRDGLRRHRRTLIPITCATRRGTWAGMGRGTPPPPAASSPSPAPCARGCERVWGGVGWAKQHGRASEMEGATGSEEGEEVTGGEEGGGDRTQLASLDGLFSYAGFGRFSRATREKGFCIPWARLQNGPMTQTRGVASHERNRALEPPSQTRPCYLQIEARQARPCEPPPPPPPPPTSPDLPPPGRLAAI
jgi:hypothetical protein